MPNQPTRRELQLQLEIRNHSPTGFEWGDGSGPAQLALALLVDALSGDHAAEAHYQDRLGSETHMLALTVTQ